MSVRYPAASERTPFSLPTYSIWIASSEKLPFCRVFVPRIFRSISYRCCISTHTALQLSTAVSSGPALGLFPLDALILQRISTILIFDIWTNKGGSDDVRISVCGFDPTLNNILFSPVSCISPAIQSCILCILYPVLYWYQA